MDRRSFLTQMAATAASLKAVHATASDADAGLALEPLADGLTLIRGGGGNVVMFNSAEGLLLVDGGSPEHSARVLKAATRLAGKSRVHTLFNTHWHWDQTGSNLTLGRAGTRIIAHENTRLWLTTDVDSKWENRVYPPLPAKALPNKTFYTTDTLSFGGEQIDYGYLPQAHTDGDIYVYFRKANVVVAGDVLSVGSYPIIDYCTTGWIGGLGNAMRTLLTLGNADTQYVPGRGAVQKREQVQAEEKMLATLLPRMGKLLAQGMSVQDMIDAAPTREFDAVWGDPKLFIANAWPGMVARARDLGASIV